MSSEGMATRRRFFANRCVFSRSLRPQCLTVCPLSDPRHQGGSQRQERTLRCGPPHSPGRWQRAEDERERSVILVQCGDQSQVMQKDYQNGQLPQLIDIIIEEKAALFVCAVGVPPKWAVDKMHAAGIPVMNVSTASSAHPKLLTPL